MFGLLKKPHKNSAVVNSIDPNKWLHSSWCQWQYFQSHLDFCCCNFTQHTLLGVGVVSSVARQSQDMKFLTFPMGTTGLHHQGGLISHSLEVKLWNELLVFFFFKQILKNSPNPLVLNSPTLLSVYTDMTPHLRLVLLLTGRPIRGWEFFLQAELAEKAVLCEMWAPRYSPPSVQLFYLLLGPQIR